MAAITPDSIEDVIRKAVEFCEREGAHEFDAPHRVDTALLSDLAARITDYRKALQGYVPSMMHDESVYMWLRTKRTVESALLASCRGGETPNNPEHTTDG